MSCRRTMEEVWISCTQLWTVVALTTSVDGNVAEVHNLCSVRRYTILR
jgi:hypothetical protein